MNTESPLQDIETLDRDGALRETADRAGLLGRVTRRGALVGGGAAAAALAFGGTASAATTTGSPAGDLNILNFALTLEYLEAAFYAEAVSGGALSGKTLSFAKTVAAHEAIHVKTITAAIGALGGTPVAQPTFDFKGTTADQATFQKTSLTLEATGVAAYLGQGPLVYSDLILGEAAQILAVEARHQAWIADIIGGGTKPSPSPSAFTKPLTAQQVLAAVQATGFITSS
jgi:hypothetical protein